MDVGIVAVPNCARTCDMGLDPNTSNLTITTNHQQIRPNGQTVGSYEMLI